MNAPELLTIEQAAAALQAAGAAISVRGVRRLVRLGKLPSTRELNRIYVVGPPSDWIRAVRPPSAAEESSSLPSSAPSAPLPQIVNRKLGQIGQWKQRTA